MIIASDLATKPNAKAKSSHSSKKFAFPSLLFSLVFKVLVCVCLGHRYALRGISWRPVLLYNKRGKVLVQGPAVTEG